MAKKRSAAASSLPGFARDAEVPPPAVSNGPRWRSPTAIPLLGGPILAGEVLIETQRNGDRVNLTSLNNRRVCDYPIAGLERAE